MRKESSAAATKKGKARQKSAAIQTLEKRLGYDFTDKQLLKLALTHRSLSASSNERLEFLGDAVLELVVSEYLYQRYPNMNEGSLSGIRSSLVSKSSLVVCGEKLALFDYVLLGLSERRGTNERGQSSVTANAVEAIIGAVYLDGGLTCCRKLILRLFGSRLDNLRVQRNFKDAKSALQELVQAKYHTVPIYTLMTSRGKPHEQTFTVSCSIPELSEKIIGEGASLKEAERAAAQLALQRINKGKL